MFIRRILFVFIFLLEALCAAAQVGFEAYIDKTSVDVSEDINLTIKLNSSSANIPELQVPSLPNFNIYSGNVSRSTSMDNGKVSSAVIFNYTLSPRFAGKSVIGSFGVVIDGKEYKTEPIEVDVYRSSPGNAKASLSKKPQITVAAPNKPAQKNTQNASKLPDFFMTANIDKTEAFLNEQINLKIRFYQSQSTVGSPQYSKPKMEGLIFEEINSAQNYETISGKQYLYTEFSSAVFGILPGAAAIGSASVEYMPPSGIFSGAFDLFFGSSQFGEAQKVESEPITLKIKPLPKENRPKAFYGAVGSDYNIKASVDNASPQTGEPVTLTVTVGGNGNMKAVSDIPAPDLGANFRVYETSSSSSTKANGGIIGGSKIYKTVIVPRASGKFNIPPTAFSYFDISSSAYKTIYSDKIELSVSPASASSDLSAVSFARNTGGNGTAAKVEQINRDINYIKTGVRSPFSAALIYIAGLDIINYISVALILIAGLILIIEASGFEFSAKKSALRRAKKDLTRAKNMTMISQALSDYLGRRQGYPIGIMTIEDVADNLKIRGAARKELLGLWDTFEMLKYAPSSAKTDNMAVNEAAQKTLKLIQKLEKEIK